MQELDQVVVVEDLRELPIRVGDIGTVVGVYSSKRAYEVEFVSLTGQTIGVATLAADKIREIHDGEIAQARPLIASNL